MPFVADKDTKDSSIDLWNCKENLLVFGDHDGDVFATGSKMEIVQACDVEGC